MTPIPRIQFEEAIGETRLLKKAFSQLSLPQAVSLKAFYGLELDEEELESWSVLQGGGTFDNLGFVTGFQSVPYTPLEHDEMWAVLGRRSGKTSGILAFILAYEALLGGHMAFASAKQQVASFFVAQSLGIAQAAIRDFVEPIISSSPLLEKEIVKSNIEGLFLKNNHIIKPAPPVIKNFRYFAIPVVAMDEAGFWYKDAESANPDFEVIRAVSPAQGQFPFRKQVGASTPWGKEGIIWEAANAGTYGHLLAEDDDRKARFRTALVLRAPTPAMQNPLISDRKWFQREFQKDPTAYKREILVEFVDSIAGLFPESLLKTAVEDAPASRAPAKDAKGQLTGGLYYIGAIDPAFRGDDFTFTVGHYDQKIGFVQDLLKKWSPSETKLNPAVILDEIKVDLIEYGIDSVYSDQYQLESLQQLAADRGFSIIGMDFTATSKSKLFGSFLQLLRNSRVKLLRMHEQYQQFLSIQRIMGTAGYIRISAPVGKHDDLVTVTVLCCAMAIQFEGTQKSNDEIRRVPTLYERAMKQVADEQTRAESFDQEFL